MRVHDSYAYRKMDVTRECISRTMELREMLLLFQTGFNLFIRSGQNHLLRRSERGKKTRQTEQPQGMDRPGVCQVPEGGGEQRKMEETGCEVICGVPITPPVKV